MTFSLIAILLGLPVFALCAILVKLSSQGPLVYAHRRIGFRGQPFGCLKFRTMYADADKRLEETLRANPAFKAEWETFFKLKNDPRVTPIGKWLRKTSLDELPQFFNVLWGDMSVVGPRPLTAEEIETQLQQKSQKILSVKPGLTCLWVTKGRNQLSLKERVDWEIYYIEHRNFWLDTSLICRTFWTMIFPKGAF